MQMNMNNIKNLQNNMKLLEKKNDNLEKIDEDNNKKISEIEEKMKDMNILGMFKGLGGDDGDNANIAKLINNLESRFTEKMNLFDERLKKIEETSYNMINSDLVHVRCV